MELVALPIHHRTTPPNCPPYKTGNQVVNRIGLALRFSNVRMRKPVYLGTILSEKSRARARALTTAEAVSGGGVSLPPLDLTEDNIHLVLSEARIELAQLFDSSVGITGQVELVELDGPFVKISLRGKFWHTRAMVLARIGNYLKQRIPEILEVEIEDEKQLDDSPANF
ncbi:NIF system FeS cluster assembly NifU C-terminal [Arabidopsis suecica]|uniref:NIF system FeS cluster assembly NifU C-terminal n=1 Tax=Arabidopsis suecica TaxID=45249 RepID=A0A8T2AIQ8_ARASU|nr:NIF system FeS cluster assembly NifU C-terminal [Arabidopsis suecica]